MSVITGELATIWNNIRSINFLILNAFQPERKRALASGSQNHFFSQIKEYCSKESPKKKFTSGPHAIQISTKY